MKVIFMFFIPFICAGPCLAQETTGNLRGNLTDKDGNPVEYAHVIATSPNLQGNRITISDTQGRFRLLALPAGLYEIHFSHIAHQELMLEKVRIYLGQTTETGMVELAEKLHETQPIVAEYERPMIDFSSTAIGASIIDKDFSTMPIGRGYRNVTLLLPHANQSYLGDETSIAGATGAENRHFIDGIDVTEPIRFTSGTKLPYNFVQEVQIRTGGYEPEYRSALGATINAITYSGGNKVSGQAYGFFANSRLASEPRKGFLEPNTGDYAFYDMGVGLGGPIHKDKLWYYLAYNPLVEQADVEIPGTGFHEDKTTAHIFAGKLTWQINEKNTLIFTTLGDPTERQSVGQAIGAINVPVTFENPDPYLHEISTGGINLHLGGKHWMGDNLLFETALSWSKHRDKHIPATELGIEEPLFIDQETGTWSGGNSDYFDQSGEVIQAKLASTWLISNHELKAGLEYKGCRWNIDQTMHTFMRFADDYFFEFLWVAEGQNSTRNPSAFIQDSWSIVNRVRLNIGVRWDGQYLITSEGNVGQTILDQWQPRLGLIFQPDKAQAHKLFASFGRFYQEVTPFPLYFNYNDDATISYITYDHDPRIDPSGGDAIVLGGQIQPEIDGLEGQHFDEFTIGYEWGITAASKLGVRGVYRTLRQGLEDGEDPETLEWEWNNPGKGLLSAYPKAKREYSALEISYQQRMGEKLHMLASYVLSKSYGNYPGLYDYPSGISQPNGSGYFDYIVLMTNSEGLLNNDRTHMLKCAGSYDFGLGIALGITASWASGTPLNEKGAAWPSSYPYSVFLQQRGEAGRTPDIWDLNLRISYVPQFSANTSVRPKFILDLLHIGSQRQAVDYDQVHYFDVDDEGNQTVPNPTYGMPIRYQPPMALRIGAEVAF